jgi:hypothetical protein
LVALALLAIVVTAIYLQRKGATPPPSKKVEPQPKAQTQPKPATTFTQVGRNGCLIEKVNPNISETLFGYIKHFSQEDFGQNMGIVEINLDSKDMTFRTEESHPLPKALEGNDEYIKTMKNISLQIKDYILHSGLLNPEIDAGANTMAIDFTVQLQRYPNLQFHKDGLMPHFMGRQVLPNINLKHPANQRWADTETKGVKSDLLAFASFSKGDGPLPLPTAMLESSDPNEDCSTDEIRLKIKKYGTLDPPAIFKYNLKENRIEAKGKGTEHLYYIYLPQIKHRNASTTIWAFRNGITGKNGYHATPSASIIDLVPSLKTEDYYQENRASFNEHAKITPFLRYGINVYRKETSK